jgi:O-antigen/teichoic acid export membrane protein
MTDLATSTRSVAADAASPPSAADAAWRARVDAWIAVSRDTIGGASLAFAVRVASAALLYLSQVVLARWMGAYEYGIYVFVWSFVLIAGGLSHLGLSMTAMRLVPEYREQSESRRLRGFLFASRAFALTAGAVVALILLGLSTALTRFIPQHYLVPAQLALFCIPFYALSDVQDGIGRGRGWMAVALVPPYILRPLAVLAGMLIAHELGWPMCATSAVAAAIIATWLAAMVQSWLLHRRLAMEVVAGPRKIELGPWLRASMPLLVVYASELVLQNADIIAISAYLTPVETGMYFAAAKTISLVMLVHYAVGSAFANRFATLNARGDHAGLRALVHQAARWTFWPSLFAACGILVIGQILLAAFSPEFVRAYPVMVILVAGYLIRVSAGPCEVLLNTLGAQRACARAIVTGAAIAVLLNITLIPLYGILGAAAANAIAAAATGILNYRAARARLGYTFHALVR